MSTYDRRGGSRCRPLWLQSRKIGKRSVRRMQASHDLIGRIKQEACLEGHRGCVNCLEWNQQGSLLASGSDDCTVIIWNPFNGSKRSLVQTGHDSYIFSVKFMPSAADLLVATCAGDAQVRLTNVLTNANLLACKSCHADRVKRLAVHPSEPNLIWSAAEDGYIMQYDTRQVHVCNSSKPNSLLIDLNDISSCLAAKCIAVNPLRSEMLAVGSNDIYNRLFDRRYLRPDVAINNSCTAYFAPGHLHKTKNRSNNLQSYGTTYLAFSSDGSELLANVHAEQVYLFSTYEPWEGYRSFESSIQPVLLDKPEVRARHTRLKSRLHYSELRQQRLNDLNNGIKEIKENLWEEDMIARAPSSAIKSINELLVKNSNCPDLYRARAIALVHRGWRGDIYQALRDCCCALTLEPLDFKAIRYLATSLAKMNDLNAVCGLLEFVDSAIEEFGGHEELLKSRDVLLTAKRTPSPSQCGPFEGYQWAASTPTVIPSLFAREFAALQDELSLRQIQAKKTDRLERSYSYDFSQRFCGHCNMNTDIKETNFFGCDDEFVVGGSDDGAFYIWDKNTSNIVKAVHADYHTLNCVQPHPNICLLATSGIEPTVKLWSSIGKVCRDIEALETRCSQNQKHISTDPLEAMYTMLYPSRA